MQWSQNARYRRPERLRVARTAGIMTRRCTCLCSATSFFGAPSITGDGSNGALRASSIFEDSPQLLLQAIFFVCATVSIPQSSSHRQIIARPNFAESSIGCLASSRWPACARGVALRSGLRVIAGDIYMNCTCSEPLSSKALCVLPGPQYRADLRSTCLHLECRSVSPTNIIMVWPTFEA